FAASFAEYFVMLANLGMPIYAMRACAEKRDDRKELSHTFNELWSINVVLSVASTVVFLVTVLLVPKLRVNGLLLAIYGSSILFQMIGCEWLFKGLEKFRLLALSSLVCKVISFICILLFVHSEHHVWLYGIFSVLATYGSSIICFIMLHHYVDFSFRIRINKKHFKPLLVFFMMSCAVSIYSSLDLTMLGFMKTEFETGLYSIAAKGKSVLAMTGSLVWSAILPLATRLWKEGDRKGFESLSAKALVIVCGIQTVVGVICIIFAKPIILLVGGEAYLGAVPAFRILLLSLIPIGASNILGGQVLIPAGKEKKLLTAEIAGAVFNFIANLILIPYLSILGAAITTVISEVIVWLICVYYVKKDMNMDFGFGIIRKAIGKLMRIGRAILFRAGNRIKGDNLPYYCPCCNTYLKRFVNGNYEKKPDLYNIARYQGMDQNVICPVCGSLPRHRILVSWMNENEEWIGGKNILYFAQEKSVRRWLNRHHIDCTTADLYFKADLKINIEDTGLNDDSYDMIICNHVLEHVSDYKKALRELYRIIRPGGRIILSFPVDPSLTTVYEDNSISSEEERIRHFGQNDHLRIFGSDSTELLKSFGFHVTEIRGENCDVKIKGVVGPANYDYNVLWCMSIYKQ
ncbi:MAG: polysaccharide biosynthesis C-terminal domain-containing protein, partial [Butyrivibrio sp.]